MYRIGVLPFLCITTTNGTRFVCYHAHWREWHVVRHMNLFHSLFFLQTSSPDPHRRRWEVRGDGRRSRVPRQRRNDASTTFKRQCLHQRMTMENKVSRTVMETAIVSRTHAVGDESPGSRTRSAMLCANAVAFL